MLFIMTMSSVIWLLCIIIIWADPAAWPRDPWTPSMAQDCWNLLFLILIWASWSHGNMAQYGSTLGATATPACWLCGSLDTYQGSSIIEGVGLGRNFWMSASAKDPSYEGCVFIKYFFQSPEGRGVCFDCLSGLSASSSGSHLSPGLYLSGFSSWSPDSYQSK